MGRCGSVHDFLRHPFGSTEDNAEHDKEWRCVLRVALRLAKHLKWTLDCHQRSESASNGHDAKREREGWRRAE